MRRSESLKPRVECALLRGDLMRVLFLIACLAVAACGRAGLNDDVDGGAGGGGGGAAGGVGGGAGGGLGGGAGGGLGGGLGGGAGGGLGGGAGGGLGGGVGGGAGGGLGGGGGGGGASCAGLSVEACRARPDCAADFCLLCTCTPNFQGCRGVTEQPASCPEVECVQPQCCGVDSSCPSSATCAPPGTPYSCGICSPQPGTCTVDQDCVAFPVVHICEPIGCSCTAQRECVPGCGPSSPCAEGTTCNASTGRCQAIPCATDANCPSTFGCSSGVCVRKACTSDLQCGDGFCVNGGCYEGQGTCRYPVP